MSWGRVKAGPGGARAEPLPMGTREGGSSDRGLEVVPPQPPSVAVSCSPGRGRRSSNIERPLCEAWAWGEGWWLTLERLCALPHTYPHAAVIRTPPSPQRKVLASAPHCLAEFQLGWNGEIGESSELGGIRDAGEGGKSHPHLLPREPPRWAVPL